MHIHVCVREKQMHIVVVGSYSGGGRLCCWKMELSTAPDQWGLSGCYGVSSLVREASQMEMGQTQLEARLGNTHL